MNFDDSKYFICEKLSARIPVSTCIARQKHNTKLHFDGPLIGCENCEQGQAIMEGKPLPAVNNRVIKQTTENKEMEVVMATLKKGNKRPCKNCRRVKSIQARGMCGLCNSSVKGLVEGSDEYIKALEDAEKRSNSGKAKTRRKARDNAQSGAALLRKHNKTEMKEYIHHMERENSVDTPNAQVIPVTLRLTVEIGIRVTGIMAG